ncbi:hypothetical protein Terro_4143 [Terriglobus roseus DSM 18391]|uniref:DUF4097 domain-containing protein n=1 Tax=Terriglobus roseus (strain DSM 18391 / NRRL B-41598 / KBS 63) TaxID=926566 RepID=I3ZM82_TERRK|nr:DUF4097 family beta strand repeat-containing protein [Terriglobus roseus]AFL90350.1 hypothetical protein Terro_4143 [Terriglobus roseus DSM 18391]
MRYSSVLATVAVLITAVSAAAQSNWDKTYNVSGRAAVQVSVDNASVITRTCGTCRTVRIHVDAHGNDLSRWHLTEMQGGNVVHFTMKRRDEERFFMGWQGRSPEVFVDLPTESDVELRSGNGGLQLTGVHGSVDVKTGNGSVGVEDVTGALRITSGNGALTVRRVEGTLMAVSGNGPMTLEGRLSQFEVRSGNGGMNIVLEPGTTLTSSSRATTGHGGMHLTVPRDLKAELDLTTGNGSLHSDLPMMSQSTSDRHHLHGNINGGGPSLRLTSGNGSVTIRSN